MVVAALLTAVERNRRYDKRIVSDKRRRMYKIIQEVRWNTSKSQSIYKSSTQEYDVVTQNRNKKNYSRAAG